MKREWILWNALVHPEQITWDERTEQVEARGYHWSYKSLEFLLCLLLLLCVFMAGAAGNAEKFSGIFLAANVLVKVMVLLSLGRFLYSCYHGIQGNADRAGGLASFLGCCVLSGFLGTDGVRGFLWQSTRLSLVVFVVGALLYGILCHVAYLRYAAVAEEEAEGHSGRLAFRLCLAVMAVYGGTAVVGTCLFYTGARPLLEKDLTAQEWDWAKEIEEGRQRYMELESRKMECFYQAEGEDETAPYQNGNITHCLYWTVPDQLYTMVLDPKTGEVYRDYYRDSGREWYRKENGRWIPGKEAAGSGTGAEGEAVQPQTEMMELQMDAVETITSTEYGVYIVEYGPSYETIEEMVTGKKSEEFAGITETYWLNEFGVLTGYQEETYRYSEEGEKILEEYSSFTLLSADVEKNQKEVRELVEKQGTAR